jgi:hypothetical protein
MRSRVAEAVPGLILAVLLLLISNIDRIAPLLYRP